MWYSWWYSGTQAPGSPGQSLQIHEVLYNFLQWFFPFCSAVSGPFCFWLHAFPTFWVAPVCWPVISSCMPSSAICFITCVNLMNLSVNFLASLIYIPLLFGIFLKIFFSPFFVKKKVPLLEVVLTATPPFILLLCTYILLIVTPRLGSMC